MRKAKVNYFIIGFRVSLVAFNVHICITELTVDVSMCFSYGLVTFELLEAGIDSDALVTWVSRALKAEKFPDKQ